MSQTVPRPTAPISNDSVAALRAQLLGRVVTRDDEGYDAARAGFGLAQIPSPDLVVLPRCVEDVQAAILAARRLDLPVAVHGTGHNFAFAYPGGMLINTGGLSGVRFDDAAGTVHVEAGVRWRDVLPGAAARGKAALSGSSPDVGVIGYTLHGGIGWLARKYGAAVDSVRSAELVTADGARVRASRDDENPELFWALRGAGGNFGVVTSLELDLVPVARVHGGALFFPMTRAQEVLLAYRGWVDTVPDEMTSSLTFFRAPPVPAVPEPLRGRDWIVVRACWCGEVGEADVWLAPLRGLGGTAIDGFRTMAWDESGEISQDPTAPTASRRQSLELADLDSQAAHVLLELAGDGAASPLTVVEIRHLGGALARGGEGHAFGRRTGRFTVQTIGQGAGPFAAEVDRATREMARALRPFGTGSVLPGFLGDGDGGPERVRAGYEAAAWTRLLEAKRRWDPGNLFRLNHNIVAEDRPAAAS